MVAPSGLIDHAVAVIDEQLVGRIARIRVLRVEEKGLIAQLAIEETVFVERGRIEGAEVVLGVDLAAVGTADLPRGRP